MRILFLSQLVPFPIDAGPKVRSYHVLQYLCAAGHEVTLVAFKRESDRADHIAHLEEMCTSVHTVFINRSKMKDGLFLMQSILKKQPFLIIRDGIDEMFQLIHQLMNKQQFDVVHTDQLWMAQYALAAKSSLNGNGNQLKLILDQHNAVYLIPERMALDSANPLKRMILTRESKSLYKYEIETCDLFDDVVWVTDEDRQALSNAARKHIRGVTIPICVDTEEKSVISRNPNAKRVTFLGGLHWPPNAEGVLWFANNVWSQIVDSMPDAVLTVIGKAPPRPLQTSEIPIQNLEVTGYVDEVEPYLKETAVFIVPLHAGGGMRVKIIDAWSWGLPIVSTSIGAEGVKYRDGENLLIGDNADGFATAVLSLLKDPELADAIALKGRQTAEMAYDWRKVYRAWDDVYG